LKNNREQDISNHKHKEICFEVRATALRPRLHHYEGFHYHIRDLSQRNLTQRNYNLVYTRSGYTTPPTQPSTQEHKTNWGYKALGDRTRSQTLSLITSYRVEYEVLLKELSERWISVRKNRGVLKPTENSFEKKELED